MTLNFKFISSILFFTLIAIGKISSEEAIKAVRYLKPNGNFSEISNLHIQRGKLIRISENKEKDNIRYVLPSFCDGYVTLGADATGGQNSISTVKTALRSFLYHGFTHIQSVGDGPWIRKIKSEIDSGKILGPKIVIANRPLIPKSKEIKDVSDLLYFPVNNKNSTIEEFERQLSEQNNIVHLFNRFNEDESFSFDSQILNQLGKLSKSKNSILTVHTFADRIAILDALISGNRYLVHPILFEMQDQIAQQHLEELHLLPILNVYRNLHLNDSKDGEGFMELTYLREQSDFFQEHYSGTYESYLKMDISDSDLENRKNEYSSYLEFIRKNQTISKKMIFASGSGNRLSFPGVSGVQEIKILSKIVKSSDSFLKIPTHNSCTYLGGSYNGEISVGQEANFIILKENPLKNIDTLFDIENIYFSGKALNLAKSGKKSKGRKK